MGVPSKVAVVQLGLFVLGIGLGVVVTGHGLPWWIAPVLSMAVYAGSVEFLLAGLSSRLAESMREEIEAAGKVSARDAEEAMTEVVAAIRRMEQAGELFLIVETEEEGVTIRTAGG